MHSTIRSALKSIKSLVRRSKVLDKIYLRLRYGSSHPFTAEYWDKIWQNEGLDTWRTYQDKFDFILSLVPSGLRVLDVGCGVGILLNRLKTEKKCEVFGVDISSKAIEILATLGIPGKVSQLPELPMDSHSFDVVIATEVIEHLHDPKETVNQMVRILRPGGTLILTTPNDSIPPDDCDEHLYCFNEISFLELVSDCLIQIRAKIIQAGDAYLVLWGKKPNIP